MRRTITIGLVIAGFALMAIGLLAAAPWDSASVSDSDPAFLGAPTLFVFGIVAIVGAAVLYELLPDRD